MFQRVAGGESAIRMRPVNGLLRASGKAVPSMRAGESSVTKDCRMLVRLRWTHSASSRVAPQEKSVYSPVPARELFWDRGFSVPDAEFGKERKS